VSDEQTSWLPALLTMFASSWQLGIIRMESTTSLLNACLAIVMLLHI
jgi:hypothetical protein